MHKQIYLAGGCFWGVQQYFALMPGVVAAETGYANGHTENPTYEQVYTGTTGFAETVRVTYDAAQMDLEFLLEQFYGIIDPTSLNRQAGDVGSHYRTGIFYTDEAEHDVIAKSLSNLQKSHDAPIVVENVPLACYYKAEEYHQNYLDKNPGGYCHIPDFKFEEAKNTKI